MLKILLHNPSRQHYLQKRESSWHKGRVVILMIVCTGHSVWGKFKFDLGIVRQRIEA